MNHWSAESVGPQSKIGVVILAAGASTRMGSPKQLLRYGGRTLLRHAVETALASMCRPVVAVIGANADLIKSELKDLPVSVAENHTWESGMGSSIRIGLEKVGAGAEMDGAVIMLCDQPFVSPDILNSLVEVYGKTGKLIVASVYKETRGVPALFSKQLFGEIAALEGNQGARQVIASHRDDVATIEFAEGAVDVDTPQDYEMLETFARNEVSTETR